MEPNHVTHPMAIANVRKASVDSGVKNLVPHVAKRDLSMMMLVKVAKVSIAYNLNETW